MVAYCQEVPKLEDNFDGLELHKSSDGQRNHRLAKLASFALVRAVNPSLTHFSPDHSVILYNYYYFTDKKRVVKITHSSFEMVL
jgi:hypothetical protein